MFVVSKPSRAFVIHFQRWISIPSRIPSKGLINLSKTSRFLQISGEDASSFINGLTTVKMLPTHLKKNQTTISEVDINNEQIVNSIQLSDDLIKFSNWGIIHENEEFDPNNEDELPLRLGIRRDGVFAHLLKANGRVFSDIFIYPTPLMVNDANNNYPNYLIEVLNNDVFKQLQMTLKLHKLRAKVDVNEVHLSSWFYYNDLKKGAEIYDDMLDGYFSNGNSKNPKSAIKLVKDFISSNILFDSNCDPNSIKGLAIDQRMDYFGIRILTDVDSKPLLNDAEVSELPYNDYLSRRIKYGITESIDFSKSTAILPFELNLDWMRGINYNKGCYMGQELTIRTYTGNGTVRRVLPIKFNEKIPNVDGNEKLEIRKLNEENDQKGTKQQTPPAYNPFGSSTTVTTTPRSRRDIGKVGEVLLNDGEKGLARIEKRCFNWDELTEMDVKVIHNGESYSAKINTSVWN